MLFKNVNCEYGRLPAVRLKPRSQHGPFHPYFPTWENRQRLMKFKVGFVQTAGFGPGAGKGSGRRQVGAQSLLPTFPVVMLTVRFSHDLTLIHSPEFLWHKPSLKAACYYLWDKMPGNCIFKKNAIRDRLIAGKQDDSWVGGLGGGGIEQKGERTHRHGQQ